MKTKFFNIMLSLVLFSFSIKAQEATDNISADNYSSEVFATVLIDSLNQYRAKSEAPELAADDLLTSAAGDQAEYMAKQAAIEIEQSKASKKTTGKRVRYYGGSSEGSEEVVFYIACAKGKEQYTYTKVVSDVMAKITKNKKQSTILNNKDYIYAGIGATMDGGGKKLYISIVLGNDAAITKGK